MARLLGGGAHKIRAREARQGSDAAVKPCKASNLARYRKGTIPKQTTRWGNNNGIPTTLAAAPRLRYLVLAAGVVLVSLGGGRGGQCGHPNQHYKYLVHPKSPLNHWQ
jgi:hypothetical protein